ncbi:polysaccharide biosynthesis C-terminal domain-containing protein [bacterium]|nr:polysaccharide biosynthesis C-terminal domain-containing protein [bacterium]
MRRREAFKPERLEDRATNAFLEESLRRLRGSGTGALLARGSLAAFTVKSAGIGLALLPQLILTRLMGASRYGVYVVALNWVWVLVVFGKLGQDTSRVRFLSSCQSLGDWGAFRGLLRWSAATVLAVSCLLGLGLALTVQIAGARIPEELGRALLAGGALLPVLTLTALNASALQAVKKVAASDTPRLAGHGALALLAAGAIFAPGFDFSPAAVMGLTFASNFLALGLGLVLLRRSLPSQALSAAPVYHPHAWLGLGLAMLAVNGQFLILNRIDILMLKFFVPDATVGVYGIAVRLAAAVPFGLDAISMIAAPLVAQLYAEKRTVELRRVVHLAVSWSALLSSAIFLALVIGGKIWLGVFGPEFPGGYVPLVILCTGQLFNALTGPSGLLLTMTGLERKLAVLIGLALPANALLNWLLIPPLGAAGAALATCTVTVGWNTVAVILIRRKLRLWCVFGLSGRTPREAENGI